MHPDDVPGFIANYTEADERFLRFDWNGKHADEFEDRNSAFRETVIEAIIDHLETVPIELVRDLYRAETECSAEAWGIGGEVSRLGEHLLRHGNDRFIEDYLEGKEQSFDAHLSTDFLYDRPLAEHLLAVVREKLRSETDEERVEFWKWGEEIFGEWVAKSETKTA